MTDICDRTVQSRNCCQRENTNRSMDVLKERKGGTTCRTGLRRTSEPIAAIDTVFLCYVKCGYIGVNEWVSGKSLMRDHCLHRFAYA